LWLRISLMWGVLNTTLCDQDQVCQWLVSDQWFPLGTLVSSTNKTDLHDITQILLKVVLSTIHQTCVLLSLYIVDNISSIAPHIYIIQNVCVEKCWERYSGSSKSERVIVVERQLRAMFQLYHGENKLLSDEMMMLMPALY
jgi:hypothetical protein